MITVTKKTQDLTEGIMALCEGAKQDYYRYATRGVPGDITGYQKDQYDTWDDKTQIKNGKTFFERLSILIEYKQPKIFIKVIGINIFTVSSPEIKVSLKLFITWYKGLKSAIQA